MTSSFRLRSGIVVMTAAALAGVLGGCVWDSAWSSPERIAAVERSALAEAHWAQARSADARRTGAGRGDPSGGEFTGSVGRADSARSQYPGPRIFEIRSASALLQAEPEKKADPAGKTSIKKEDLLDLSVEKPMLGDPSVVQLRLPDAVHAALRHSHQIAIAGYTPAIRAAEILEAQGAFDAIFFVRGDSADPATGFPGVLYQNKDQPASSTLGGGTPLQSKEITSRIGIQQFLPTGGTVHLSQRLSYTDSNSTLLAPNPQAGASMSIAIVQPLLRGAGLDVNRAKIFIGTNNKDIGVEEFRRLVIKHLADVETAYWNLIAARYTLAIQLQLLALQRETSRRLDARQDVLPFTRDRAKAAVAQVEAAVIKSRNAVRDGQDRLKVLINDPELTLRREVEILPVDPLTDGVVPIDQEVREASLRAALENRPEIRQSRLEIKNAAIREGVSRNELLPQLNVLAETIPQGLANRADNAFNQQWRWDFQDWVFGVTLEIPIGNRVARAHVRRDRLLREQSIVQLSNTVQNAYFDVSTALHSLESTQQEIPARRAALDAAAAELAARTFVVYESTPREQIASSLEFLLTSQERLASSHQAMIESRTAYNNGIVRLEQAKGTLLHYNNVELNEDPHAEKTPRFFYEPRDVRPK